MPSVTAAPSQPALTPRRRELLDAALHVVADEGLRGLTHRAVDREAGLAEGSTSAYFRSRDALQSALADFVSRRLSADVERLGEELAERGDDAELLAAATARLFGDWLDNPTFLRARLELTVAAARDQALAERFLIWRRELVNVVDRILSTRRTGSSPTGAAPSAETTGSRSASAASCTRARP